MDEGSDLLRRPFAISIFCWRGSCGRVIISPLAPPRPLTLLRSPFIAFLWLAWLLPAVARGEGTAPYVSQTWTAENGLRDNTVCGLAQSPDGYLWVATQSSLCRFDGFDFRAEPIDQSLTITTRLIRAICCDHLGQIWMGLESGAALCFSHGQVKAYPIVNPTTRDWPNGLAEDGAGAIWLVNQRGGVWRIRGGRVEAVGEQEGVPEKSGPSICADRDGVIWLLEADELAVWRGQAFESIAHGLPVTSVIGARRAGGVWLASEQGLCAYTEEAGFGEEYTFPEAERSRRPSVVKEDGEGNVWIGSSPGGLLCWNGAEMKSAPTRTDDVLALAEDRQGDIWVGAQGGGLRRLTRSAAEVFSLDQGLPSAAAYSIAVDDRGSLWLVSRDGEVVCQPAAGPLERLPRPPWSAVSIAAGRNGKIWVGTGNFGVFEWDGANYLPVGDDPGLRADCVRALYCTRAGDLLISGQTSGLHRLHDGRLTTFSLPQARDFVRAFAEDSRGDIWAGTIAGRLLRVREVGPDDVTPAQFPADASIRSLQGSAGGGLWIGFANHGFGRLTGNVFVRADLEAGLRDEAVSQLAEDTRGDLWIGGDRGYSRIALREFASFASGETVKLRRRRFSLGEGIPALQAGFSFSPNAAKLADGRLAFATSVGAVLVDPAKSAKSEKPLVHLLSIEVDGRKISLAPSGSELRIPSRGPRLSVEFTAIDLAAPENVYFRYRLQGYDSGWSEPTQERRAVYARLPPGRYGFQVAASSSAGEWSAKPAGFSVTVVPTLAETVWARILALALFTSAIALLVRQISMRRVRRRLRQAERDAAIERERTRIARDMHDELGATLTQIALLGELPGSADSTGPHGPGGGIISQTARRAMKSLDEIVWAVNPQNDRLEDLLDYLGQFAAEYLDIAGIRCRLEFPETIPEQVISGEARHQFFLAAREAVHNIVKHSGATEVYLQAEILPEVFTMSIRDNGRGFQNGAADRFANGLHNITERLALVGGSSRVETISGQGTKVILVMPWPIL